MSKTKFRTLYTKVYGEPGSDAHNENGGATHLKTKISFKAWSTDWSTSGEIRNPGFHYELQRTQKIAENHAKMVALGIMPLASSLMVNPSHSMKQGSRGSVKRVKTQSRAPRKPRVEPRSPRKQRKAQMEGRHVI